MTNKSVDLIVVGAGPGGYIAAIRAAQLGMKVLVVDKRSALGGTCLNVGCIPSKALLHTSHQYAEASQKFSTFGINFSKLSLDLDKMLSWKTHVVDQLTKGIEFLFKKNKVTFIQGTAKVLSADKVEIHTEKGTEKWYSRFILVATGSESTSLPGIEIDEESIVSSTGALSLKKVPEHLIVVGGGYIGLELGSVWQRLGAKVTVIEYMDRLVPQMDQDLSGALQKSLSKQGMTFNLSTAVKSISKKKGKLTVEVEQKTGEPGSFDADTVLIATGRKPYTQGLGLEKIGVALDEKGFIPVNRNFETSVSGVYAIGDVIDGPMLAHKAEEEGVAAVEIMAGQSGHVDYKTIPSVIYTSPEVASVGHTEEELKAREQAYSVGKFPFLANSRAKAIGETEGFVKILADKYSDQILGVHIIGPDAGTLIAEVVLAMEFTASAEDIARTCHAHPTFNEAVKEAALDVDKRSIHQ